jgi:hypothetical protein
MHHKRTDGGQQAMTTPQQKYAAIADELRRQRFPDLPVKHEWVELLTRLCRDNNHNLREIGIAELRDCADRATHGNQV